MMKALVLKEKGVLVREREMENLYSQWDYPTLLVQTHSEGAAVNYVHEGTLLKTHLCVRLQEDTRVHTRKGLKCCGLVQGCLLRTNESSSSWSSERKRTCCFNARCICLKMRDLGSLYRLGRP